MCIGSMDGKHIVIQSPKFSGSEFFNYKETFSIVLFAIVDENYNFTYVYVGCQGRISFGGVFESTGFAKALNKSVLNLPDDAFPLTTNIMEPYAGHQDRGSRQRISNYRLSRARRVVENVFGTLASVFRVLRKPMLLEPSKAEKVLACVFLHNYLRHNVEAEDIYTPPGSFDVEDSYTGTIIPGQWRIDRKSIQSLLPLKNVARKSPHDAKEVRDEFSEYFISEIGQVSWQLKHA
ncbi:hypothetical protein JTB14_017427 [Gonioctena quinquepunctata]|nr:hypothetical protein JTB14_017427 [Gonioctena quinquepunctata]